MLLLLVPPRDEVDTVPGRGLGPWGLLCGCCCCWDPPPTLLPAAVAAVTAVDGGRLHASEIMAGVLVKKLLTARYTAAAAAA